MAIHPSAIIDKRVEMGKNNEIGPNVIIDGPVQIGSNNIIAAGVLIKGRTIIGNDNHLYSYAMIGEDPQDISFDGSETATLVGNTNIIREFVTINRGSVGEGEGVTRIGDHCLFMAYSHVAHDCIIGNQVIMANAATLAGHVILQDHAILGGLSAVHQFVRIGTHAFIGGTTGVDRDIPPYVLAAGNRAKLRGLNTVGLKRRDFSEDAIKALKECYRIVFRQELPIKEALDEAERRLGDVKEVRIFVDFIRESERGITR